MELGSTTWRIVCQRVAPTFQQASRNAIGTEASASLVLVMITGSVMIASVSEAARIDLPDAGEQHERAHAEQRVHDAGHARQVDHGQVDDAREPVVAGVLVQITPRPARRSAPRRRSEITTR